MKEIKITILTLASFALLIGLMAFNLPQAQPPAYLNPDLPVESRVKDLMARMTLEEKVAQMCQYVGLEHMKKAEVDLTEEEMKKSDAQGFYPNLFSKDVAEMAKKEGVRYWVLSIRQGGIEIEPGAVKHQAKSSNLAPGT